MSLFKFIFRISMIIISVTFIMLYLMEYNYVMRISFEKEKLEKKLSEIKRENELLEIEASRKTGLAQIDKYAVEKLAMNKPQRVEFIIFEGK